MTKYFDEHIRKVPRRQQPSDNIIIGDTNDSVKEYICPYCNCIIKTRIAEDELYCSHCKSNFILEDVRKKSKLEVPREHNSEVFVSTTPGVDYLTEQARIKKEPVLKGGFKVLSEKGIKITN